MAHEVFISYSSKDKTIADAVCATIENRKIRCWIAPRDVPPGLPYAAALISAINDSKVFVLLLSEGSNSSGAVMREVEEAVGSGIPIIPIRIEDIEPTAAMRYYIKSLHWIDAISPPLEKHLGKLVDSVQTVLSVGEKEDRPPFPEPETAIETPAKSRWPLQTGEQMSANPFTFGNPIRDPQRFIGRKEDIRQIVNRLLSSARESTSIVGERRIGKTSLLKHLSDPDVAEQYGLSKDQFCPVYIDFQGLTDITPERFWQRVLRKMSRSMNTPELNVLFKDLSRREQVDLFDLEDLFEEISDLGLHALLYLDEFEYVTQNPNFEADFFGGLRALAIHNNLSLIPATRRELVDLCHSEEIKGSPFFNIFATVVLRPFSPQEADNLLDLYTQSVDIIFSETEKHIVHKLAKGYPFFLQMAGHYLVEGMNLGMQGESLEDYAASEFNQQAEPHFTYMWSHASESEKITLLAILVIKGQKDEKRNQPSIENIIKVYSRAPRDIAGLLKRGAVVDQDGSISIFSSGFEDWIALELTALPGEEENEASVEAWLKAGGDEKLQPAKGILPKVKKKYWPIIGNIMREMSFELAGAAAFEILTRTML
ncbi:MAG: TIR domain-containing protein [Anaerolineales bacterium]|nr:TIR domain-containing protein [Anaerolineales bacterium]